MSWCSSSLVPRPRTRLPRFRCTTSPSCASWQGSRHWGARGTASGWYEAVQCALALRDGGARLVRTERELLLRGRQVSGVAEFARFTLTAHEIPDLFDTAVRLVTDALGVSLAAVFEPIPGSDLILVRSGAGWRNGVVGLLLHQVEPSSAIARVLAHGTPVTDDAPFAGGRGDGIPVLREHRVLAGAAVALPGGAGPQGVLAAYATDTRTFKPEDVHFLQAIATLLAAALDRRTTEQGLLESQIRLQSVQKMEAIGRLAGGIAHDFNNLVQAIGGYTDILLRSIPDHDVLHRHVEEIKKAGDRAAALTQQLLAFSRQQVMQPKVLQLNSVVRNVETLLRRLIGEDVELETALSPGLGAVRADAAQLEQVLMNLAVNSRDAMPEGGTLTIETRDVVLTRSDQREAFLIKGGPYVLLSVSDTGHGMDAETRAARVRPVLHDQAPGPWHRARALHGLRHRQAERRVHLGGQRARAWHARAHLPAARGRSGRKRGPPARCRPCGPSRQRDPAPRGRRGGRARRDRGVADQSRLHRADGRQRR